MKLSNVINDYRKRMQISQREFARRCGLSNSYISFIENEYNPRTGRPIVPTLEQYQKIAFGMSLSVQQLFELLDEDSPVDMSCAPELDPRLASVLASYKSLPPAGKDYIQQQLRIAQVMFSEHPAEFNKEE